MISHEQLDDVLGSTAYDSDGDKIGKVGNVYYDDETNQPKWLTVHTGLFGTNETFIPVQGSELTGDGHITTAYDKGTVKDAPNVSADGHLSPEEEQQLYRHYSLGEGDTTAVRTGTGTDAEYAPRDTTGTEYAERDSLAGGEYAERDTTGTEYAERDTLAGGGRRDLAGESDVVGRDTSGPTTDKAMTRSEEQLRVGTETREVGRARLRKHIVTENVSTSVPVSHEEVTLQREPITEANRGEAMAGGDLTEEEHEVTLHEERAVTQKDVVPVERVRLGTETVTGTEQVDDSVRKEVIDTDGAEGVRGDGEVVEGHRDVVEGHRDVVEGDRDVVEGDRDVVEGDRFAR